MPQIEATPSFVRNVYATMAKNLDVMKARLNRPLTLAEKILYGHLHDAKGADLTRGEAYTEFKPDRVILQDATAQMAILQFMQAKKDEAAVPVTIHCDHLIRAHKGADSDLGVANKENEEVYDFLHAAGQRYGFGFWKPGAGIIHQVALEQYAFPGCMMLGTDSHTPNAGGLGCFACGVGGADAVDVMVGLPWEVLHPFIVGVKLTGELKGWAAPKDVIQKLLEKLTCEGGTNRVIEYFGEGCRTISATGKATICNMGAELGATTSVFPYDDRMDTYLKVTGRENLLPIIHENKAMLVADAETAQEPNKYYDLVIEIDLSNLTPSLVGPHSPDAFATVENMAEHLKSPRVVELNKGQPAPANLTYALIGSCTNSSYEDMGRIALLADQLLEKGVTLKTPLMVTPGSEQVRATIERDGIMEKLERLGATVLANACGPCIGQWQRDDVKDGTVNSIISSYNRNFPKRNDGFASTCSFIASPETVLAYAVHGRLDINPFTTPVTAKDGSTFMLRDAAGVDEVPASGFVPDEKGYDGPEGNAPDVKVNPTSDRLQLLDPFKPWNGKDYENLPLLIKAKGKCTTDHISPAGPWLKYRGHLDNISNNMYLGAINAFSGQSGKVKSQLDGSEASPADIARQYKAQGLGWVFVGDYNVGEGSSREHAAMSPRWLGCKAAISRTFARIHQSNLKKQGVLPLTFANPEDYDLVEEADKVSIHGLSSLAPGKPLKATLHHADGSSNEITLNHTLNEEQIEWFKAGSALNALNNK
ncbi:MAG: aconitate hydratase [Alphaproteobacteria bacterium CG_4_10_14_0_8_um_filter_53_9]|nr:MAG: aconitate hydratase [Alphaproteobacteria bacterium CG_4_10_14_0_8_um_filter_53_9]